MTTAVGFPLEKGNAVLCKEFGGFDLSIGQWQKLAIARGLYRTMFDTQAEKYRA